MSWGVVVIYFLLSSVGIVYNIIVDVYKIIIVWIDYNNW